MKIPLNNLVRENALIRVELTTAFDTVLQTGRFIGGDAIAEFESEFGRKFGYDHVVGTSNGTDALYIALLASGIGPGDEVITSDFTFASPAQAIVRVGATPVFADVDPRTFVMTAETIAPHINEHTRAILPVHLFGLMADMKSIRALADIHALHLIEDCAQAVGSTRDGVRPAELSNIGCFSFFPTKNLGALGDAGGIVCHQADDAQSIRQRAHHGCREKYVHETIGGNFRLDALQAACLTIKLRSFAERTERRRAIAKSYDAKFGEFSPFVPKDVEHTYHRYVIRHPNRSMVLERLKQLGIETAIYYPTPMHRQPCFTNLSHLKNPTVSLELSQELFAIPLFPSMSEDEIAHVKTSVCAVL